jgi:hypothetical protein
MSSAMKAYLFWTAAFPSAIMILTCVPGVNFVLFSLHGGIGWLLLYACGPFTLIRLIYAVITKRNIGLGVKAGLTFLAGYLIVTLLVGLLGLQCLNATLGTDLPHLAIWKAANLPWSLIASKG